MAADVESRSLRRNEKGRRRPMWAAGVLPN